MVSSSCTPGRHDCRVWGLESILRVGIPAKRGLHLVKYFAVAKAASNTFGPFIFSRTPLYCRCQECSPVLESILVHELVEEKGLFFVGGDGVFVFGFGVCLAVVLFFFITDVLRAL